MELEWSATYSSMTAMRQDLTLAKTVTSCGFVLSQDEYLLICRIDRFGKRFYDGVPNPFDTIRVYKFDGRFEDSIFKKPAPVVHDERK